MTRLVLLIAALLHVAAGCHDPAAPRTEIRRGTIRSHSEGVEVEYPDTVQPGEDFFVRVTTFGGGCVEQGHTEVGYNGDLEAVVEPYDLVTIPPEGVYCTAILKTFHHGAQIRFDEPGTATLAFVGLEEPGGDVIVETRSISVQ